MDIDRSLLDVPSDDNEWEALIKFADDVACASTYTEQEIVKPYLEKIRSEIESIDLLAAYTRGDIKRMVLAIIDKYKTESENE